MLGLISGSYDKGAVEVTNCFAVPHNESDDEVSGNMKYKCVFMDFSMENFFSITNLTGLGKFCLSKWVSEGKTEFLKKY